MGFNSGFKGLIWDGTHVTLEPVYLLSYICYDTDNVTVEDDVR